MNRSLLRARSLGTLFVATLLAAGLPTSSPTNAGTFNEAHDLGDAIPAWGTLAGADGLDHPGEEWSGHDALVIVFTCNGCPYAVDLEDRLDDLATSLSAAGGRAAVIAINSNQIDEDSLEAIVARARERDFHFPYLRDADQEVAKAFGATRTPECFVLDRDRRIVYMGAFDDSPDGSDVRRRYVEEAVEAVLAGRSPETGETAPVGCLIRAPRRRASPPSRR